jgi:adenosine deaminase
LLIVPHAGEICGPESVWQAIKLFEANRIAHGVRAAEDPTLLTKLAQEQITCDVCLYSNLMLNIYPDISQHPLPDLLEAGVPVSLSCDDKLFFKSEITQEYKLAMTAFGLGYKEIAAIAKTSINASGAPQEIKETALLGIDQWEQIFIQ